jgi:hypothetical protein
MLFGFPGRDQARLFPALHVDNKQETADPANCLPPRFAGRVVVAVVNTLNPVRIGEHKLSVFKADFVFLLVFSVLVFVQYDPALFHAAVSVPPAAENQRFSFHHQTSYEGNTQVNLFHFVLTCSTRIRAAGKSRQPAAELYPAAGWPAPGRDLIL